MDVFANFSSYKGGVTHVKIAEAPPLLFPGPQIRNPSLCDCTQTQARATTVIITGICDGTSGCSKSVQVVRTQGVIKSLEPRCDLACLIYVRAENCSF